MTRIQSKAPPIQQPPMRERPSGEAAGKPFNDVLNAKPLVEPRSDARLPQHDMPAPGRDAMSSHAYAQQGWDASLARPGPEHSLADTATVVQSPVSDFVPPATTSAYPGLDSTQSSVPPGQEATLMDADHATDASAQVAVPAAASSALPEVALALPPSPLNKAGAIAEPSIEVPSKSDVVALGEAAAAAAPCAEDALLAHAALSPPSLGTASVPSDRQAMPPDAKGASLPHGDETTIAVPSGLWCELPAPFEESPTALVPEILMPEGGNTPEPHPLVLQPQTQVSPPSVEAQLVPEAATQQVQAPVQLQTGMGPDQQDWILRPWRLQASAGLSYLSNGAQAGASGDASLLTGPISGDVRSRMATSGVDVTEGGSLPARWKSVLRLPVQLESVSGRMEADGIEASDPIDAKGGQLAALVHWSQRVLRWSGSAAGAGITAWVRDYGLAASDVPALIDSLVALATEQGFSLARIVINGHEAWSAGEQHMTRGNHDGR